MSSNRVCTFPDLGITGDVHTLLLDNHNHLYVGGSFTQIAGATRGNLARLNLDGTIDTNWTDPQITRVLYGRSRTVIINSLDLEPEGTILVAGDFTTYRGQDVRGRVRIIGENTPTGLNFCENTRPRFTLDFVKLTTRKLAPPVTG